MLRLLSLAALVVACSALTCQDLDLVCSGAHAIEFSYTLNQSAIPSFDGSAYIWAKSGTVVTSQTESVHCQEFTNYLQITSNGIPNHNVGKFPFTVSTTGHHHGDNPNTIKPQTYTWKVPKTPVAKAAAPTQNIMTNFNALQMGPIGFALNGVPIFNPFNAQREDAVNPTSNGFEVMDLCFGHPQMHGGYHYHHQAPKAGCLFVDTPGKHSPKIGYAFDGVPVYGPLSDNGVKPTDLDLCNGRTHATLGYIYHITELKAPYMIGCYRYQTTDAFRGGTIVTTGATAVSGVSTACSAMIGQKAANTTAPTSKPATTKPTTGGTTNVGGGCPNVRQSAGGTCPTACTGVAQCSGATSVCCMPSGCTTGQCLRPCPTMACTNTCPGARSPDTHGCLTCTCAGTQSGSSMPPPMSTPPQPRSSPMPHSSPVRHRTGTGSPRSHTATRPGMAGTTASSHRPRTGTGTRHLHRTSPPPHTGTGSRMPMSPRTAAPTTSAKQVSAGNQGATTFAPGASPSSHKTTVILGVVAGVVVAIAAMVVIVLVLKYRSSSGRAEASAKTYKELEEDLSK